MDLLIFLCVYTIVFAKVCFSLITFPYARNVRKWQGNSEFLFFFGLFTFALIKVNHNMQLKLCQFHRTRADWVKADLVNQKICFGWSIPYERPTTKKSHQTHEITSIETTCHNIKKICNELVRITGTNARTYTKLSNPYYCFISFKVKKR